MYRSRGFFPLEILPIRCQRRYNQSMRIPIDRRVWPGVVVLLGMGGIGWFISRDAGLLSLFLLACHLAFFRDPQRKIPAGENPVSPADGQVAEVASVFEGRYLNEEAVKVGIFLSIFVPHVTRCPMGGRVRYLHYEPGKFLNALREDSVNHNESNWIGVEGDGRRVLFRQIAGAIARRIHCDVGLEDSVGRGGKVGIICYGSRLECFFPKRLFQSAIRVGEPVKAGETILGRWRA